MKTLIQQLLRESLLAEKLANIDSDVDMLYTKYFSYDIDKLKETGVITRDMFLNTETSTNTLQSNEAVIANKKNLCGIFINTKLYNGRIMNFYQPSTSVISIGINDNALNYVLDQFNGNLKNAINDIDDIEQQHSLAAEFTEEKIKGSIHHELAHWIDDTMHNKHIAKRTQKATELGTNDIGGIPVNSTKMEIEGQIHNVKQLRNKYSDKWDELSFNDLIRLSPTLYTVNKQLKGDVKTKWLRDLKTRMHREGLLGKNMVNSQ